MTTQTRNPDPAGQKIDLSATRIFSLLSSTRRRYALHYLFQKVGAVSLGELAEQIAIWEGNLTRDQYERIYVSLLHVHVPKFEDADVVRYHHGDETVELTDTARFLRPHLDLTVDEDLQ